MTPVETGARHRPGPVLAIVGGGLGAVISALLAVSYPLVAPIVAILSIAHSVVQYRETRAVVWLVLAVIAASALIVALVIDLGLLVNDQQVGSIDGPIPTNR